MSDGISIQSTIGKSGEVSRVQQSQGARADSDHEFSKHLRADREPQAQTLREVAHARDARIQDERERSRREREEKRRRAKAKKSARNRRFGTRVDIKV